MINEDGGLTCNTCNAQDEYRNHQYDDSRMEHAKMTAER